MKNALSFDIEEAFMSTNLEETLPRSSWPALQGRVVANTHRALEALARHGQRATFFIVGWVAERHPELVRAIDSAGHETAAHSFWHRLVYSISPDEFREDIRRNAAAISDVTGKPVLGFRAPAYSITMRSMWALDVLLEEGFAYDSSIYPVRFHSRYGVADAPHVPYRHPNGLVEFPLPVARIGNQLLPFGTGAYFRLLPYTVTTWLMRRSNAAGVPVTVNIHPWELDPDQPALPMPFKYRWRHYTNLRRTAPRLESLLSTYRFRTLQDALDDVPPVAARSAA